MTDVRFDAQIFEAQRRGGISRYFVELMRQYDADPALGVRVSTPFRRVVNEHLVESYPGRYAEPGPLDRIRSLFERSPASGAQPADVVHFTYYDPAYLDSAHGLPTVSTVHDMIPELIPADFPQGNPHRAKAEFVARSTSVICISEATRRDLLRVEGDVRAELFVVPHGVGDEFRDPRPAGVALPESYVLFVGHRGGYKDFAVLLDALASSGELRGLDLVCLGGSDLTADERARIAELGLGGRVQRLAVSDADLPGVYARALCFVYPSRYEGFGLPILEAMAAGCPVIAADTDVFREVADDAATFVPVGEASGFGAAIASMMGDASSRTARIEAGRLRAAGFTWRRTAERTAAVYESTREAGRT